MYRVFVKTKLTIYHFEAKLKFQTSILWVDNLHYSHNTYNNWTIFGSRKGDCSRKKNRFIAFRKQTLYMIIMIHDTIQRTMLTGLRLQGGGKDLRPFEHLHRRRQLVEFAIQ